MVKIRLSRIGRKNIPAYKIVVTDSKAKRDTDFIEELGFYQPLEKALKINKERAEYWISVGAQLTDTTRALMVREKIMKPLEKKVTFTKKPGKKLTERVEAAKQKAEKAKAEAEAPKEEVAA